MMNTPPTSREAILQAIRAAIRSRHADAPVPLPDVRAAARAFASLGDDSASNVLHGTREIPHDLRDLPHRDLANRFADAARAAGAHVVECARGDVSGVVADSYPNARRIVSVAPDVAGTAAMPGSPHALADIDLFVCEGAFGVAENGAVWLPGSRLGLRAGLFLAPDVAIVLRRASLVADLHAAYERLGISGEHFGTFVAGPSKTADIEQSLVVGAHGPKSLTIALVDER